MKTIALVRARSDPMEFRRWLQITHAAHLARALGVARRIVIQIADLPVPGESAPVYDAVIEAWSESSLVAELEADAELASRAVVEVRGSEEVTGKTAPTTSAAGVSPGISQLSFIAARPGMPRADALRHWSEHIPLAVEVHVGMDRYVQDRLAPCGAGEASWFGMAHLHFPDEASLVGGMFRSPDDVAVITADVAEFVGDVATMRATEHVLRA